MAIILDYNQVCIANLMTSLTSTGDVNFDEDSIRHMVLNTIRFNLVKFRPTYGDLIIATDSQHKNWRREYFPYYKARRKTTREKSTIDWVSFYTFIHKVRVEIQEHMKYPVINIEGAEADDLIGVLSKYISKINDEKVLILSGDKDFVQLQTDPNIRQYSPVKKVSVFHASPDIALFEQICKGDSDDGVPNILSDDDTFVVQGKRQKPVTQKKLDGWYADRSTIPADRWERNYNLIDLSNTPLDIAKESVSQYKSQLNKTPRLAQYFSEHGLRQHYASMQEF